jgi:hypothetical protein
LPSWPEEARLFGDDQQQFWSFGSDVALDGDTAIVGADGADIGGVTDQGAAYVFVRRGRDWIQEAQLLADDGAESDRFGRSVALQGDTAVVGSIFANVDGQSAEGAVYVFTRSGTTWAQLQKLTASDGDALDWLGGAVAIDGYTILAGAWQEEGGVNAEGCQGSGAAYVFVEQGGLWVEEAKLFDPDGECSDLFGHDVDLEGDLALVGANSTINGSAGGSAYVYTRAGASWSLEEELVASDGAMIDQFGYSVALDRDAALIGAYQKEIDGNSQQGAAYVFRRTGASWLEEQRLTASDGQTGARFGWGVELLGNLALVGAPDMPGGGVVYEFRLGEGVWMEVQGFSAPVSHGLDQFGRSMSLTPERLLVADTANVAVNPPGGTAWIFGRPVLFSDGFESGSTSAWDQVVP